MIKICGYKTIIGKRRLMATTVVPKCDVDLILADYASQGLEAVIG